MFCRYRRNVAWLRAWVVFFLSTTNVATDFFGTDVALSFLWFSFFWLYTRGTWNNSGLRFQQFLLTWNAYLIESRSTKLLLRVLFPFVTNQAWHILTILYRLFRICRYYRQGVRVDIQVEFGHLWIQKLFASSFLLVENSLLLEHLHPVVSGAM